MSRSKYTLNVPELAAWIGDQRKRGELERVELRHVTGKSSFELVERYGFQATENDGETYEGLAATIDATARRDAGATGGVQSYSVVPFFAGDRAPSGRFMFWMHEAEETHAPPVAGARIEPASYEGLLTQLMRHTETKDRIGIDAMHAALRVVAAENKRLSERNERLEDGRQDVLEALEALVNERSDRELAHIRAKNDERRKEDLLKTVKVLGPMVVNKLVGRRVLPERTTSTETQIREIFATMELDEIIAVQDAIKNPAAKAALADLVVKFASEPGAQDDRREPIPDAHASMKTGTE